MTLGQRIQELRKQNNLSQEALGEKLGVSRQAISRWEMDLSHSSGYHTTNPRLHYCQNIKFWRYIP